MKSRFFLSFVLFLIAFLIIFYLICFYCLFQIKRIEIEGNQKVRTRNIRNLVEVYLSKKIIFWDSRSIFLADLGKIKKEILDHFPQIREVLAQRRFPDELIISVKERRPIGIIRKDDDYFFIDREGVMFEKADNQESQWLEIIPPDTNKNLKIGEIIIEKKLIWCVAEIEKQLEKKEIPLHSIKIVSRERANALTQEGWEIYFNLDDDISRQIFHLDLVLKKKIPPSKRKDLEYIDLRFGNQIFYK